MNLQQNSVADRNVERLVGAAYSPEIPDIVFVQNVEEKLLFTACQLAEARRPTPAQKPAPPNANRRLAWAASLAAVLMISFLAWYAQIHRGGTATNQAIPPQHEIAETTIDPIPPFGLTPRPRPTAEQPKPIPIGQTLTTQPGERRRVTLIDGSIVYLNQNSEIKQLASRRLQLTRGQVYLEVAPSTAFEEGTMPASFVVLTPDREVSALGTRFAVEAERADTGVLVTQGKVKVSGIQQMVEAGQQLPCGQQEVVAAPRASHQLDWTRELMAAAESPLVPAGKHSGGGLVAIDPQGQEIQLTLRKYLVDVHIEDGFARTTIDQTYFNNEYGRLEGTFHFPLPPDATLSRLAMYVENGGSCKLNEGGMAERDLARQAYETIRHTNRDPALLEWVDGSTFKMRVFPLEGRKEKRIILSYTQRLGGLYGTTKYRFPSGYNMNQVQDWTFQASIKHGAKSHVTSPSRPAMKIAPRGPDMLAQLSAKDVRLNQDVALEIVADQDTQEPRFSSFIHESHQYVMLRFRPDLTSQPKRERRDWVFLFESSANRDPLLARAQIEVIRSLLQNAEHDDTFSILVAGPRVQLFDKEPRRPTKKNIEEATKFLDGAHLIGALDLEKALRTATPLLAKAKNPHLVHVGAGIPAMGERRDDALVKLLPEQVRYIGVAIGKRWNRAFMKAAADRTHGYFTQINPDETISWRAFDLLATLNTPRLLDVHVMDSAKRVAFLTESTSLCQGEELCAVARIGNDGVLPNKIVVTGQLSGKPFTREFPLKNIVPNAGYLPRQWAKLEIDRLLADDSDKNKPAIVELSKASYVMSPFTSLLVLETEEDYTRFKVDRGRKDHWAMYDCPNQIPIVHEPASQERQRLEGPSDATISNTRIQVKFTKPAGMKIQSFMTNDDGKGQTARTIDTPGSYNFRPGKYRLKLTNIADRPDLEVYPTMEVMAANPKTESFLDHSAVPVWFTDDDFKLVTASKSLVKVTYLPDPEFQDVAGTGTEEIRSTQLEPGEDPIKEASRRGKVLLVIRMGKAEQEAKDWPKKKPEEVLQTILVRTSPQFVATSEWIGYAPSAMTALAVYGNVDDVLSAFTGSNLASQPARIRVPAQRHEKLAEWRSRIETATAERKAYGNALQAYHDEIRAGRPVLSADLQVVSGQLSAATFKQFDAIAGYNNTLASFDAEWLSGMTWANEGLLPVDRTKMEKKRDTLQELIRKAVPSANVNVVLGNFRSSAADDSRILSGSVLLTGTVLDPEKMQLIHDLSHAVFANVAAMGQPSYEPGPSSGLFTFADPLGHRWSANVGSNTTIAPHAFNQPLADRVIIINNLRQPIGAGVNTDSGSIGSLALQGRRNWSRWLSRPALPVIDIMAQYEMQNEFVRPVSQMDLNRVVRPINGWGANNNQLPNSDWAQSYKNHGYQIGDGSTSRIQFAPVFVSPTMQWAVPNAPSPVPNPLYGTRMYLGVEQPLFGNKLSVLNQSSSLAGGGDIQLTIGTGAGYVQKWDKPDLRFIAQYNPIGFGIAMPISGATRPIPTGVLPDPYYQFRGVLPLPRVMKSMRDAYDQPWQPESESDPTDVLYHRPTVTPDPRLFHDLLLHAPGLNTGDADILAVLAAETALGDAVRTGKIDAAARTLIDKARALDWSSLTFGDTKFHFNGAGQYAFQRTLSSGLGEQVICDGKTLVHLYAEIGLGAKRTVSRFHRAELVHLVPWHVLSAEDLAHGADVKLVDERTVALVPITAGGVRPLSPVLGGEGWGEGEGSRAVQKLHDLSRDSDAPPSPQPSPPEYRGRGGRTGEGRSLGKEFVAQDSLQGGVRGGSNATNPSAGWQVHLIFARDGRLSERQLIEMPSRKVLYRETYDADGTIQYHGTKTVRQKLKLAKAETPNLKPDVSKLVLVPMPLRTSQHLAKTAIDSYAQRDADLVISLIAAYCLEDQGGKALQAFGERFHAKGDRRIGFYTLLATTQNFPAPVWRGTFGQLPGYQDNFGLPPTVLPPTEVPSIDLPQSSLVPGIVFDAPYRWNTTQTTFKIQSEHPKNPLAGYLAHLNNALQKHGMGPMRLTAPKDSFLMRQAEFHDQYKLMVQACEGPPSLEQRQAQCKKSLEYLQKCPSGVHAWIMLEYLQRFGQIDTADFDRTLTDLTKRFGDTLGMADSLRYEQARTDLKAGHRDQARKAFTKLYTETMDKGCHAFVLESMVGSGPTTSGCLPRIDADFIKAFEDAPKGEDFPSLVRQTLARFTKEQAHHTNILFAWQLWQLGETTLAKEIFTHAMPADPVKDIGLSLAGIDYLGRTKQWAAAEKILDKLLTDEKLAQVPALWRMGAMLANKRGSVRRVVICQEKALDLEFKNLPEAVDLQAVRQEFGDLLRNYQQLAQAMATLDAPPSAELVQKVIRAADRWRSLDPEPAKVCEQTAKILKTLGARELAWDYLTTPIGLQPNESAPWVNLAGVFINEGELDQADRAYAEAFAAEPTNPQILWDRAQNRLQLGQVEQARLLYRQIADGAWQPRFQNVQNQSRLQMQGN